MTLSCAQHLSALQMPLILSLSALEKLGTFFPPPRTDHRIHQTFLAELYSPWTPEYIIPRDPDQLTYPLLCFFMQVLLWKSWLSGLIWKNVESTRFIQGCFLCKLTIKKQKATCFEYIWEPHSRQTFLPSSSCPPPCSNWRWLVWTHLCSVIRTSVSLPLNTTCALWTVSATAEARPQLMHYALQCIYQQMLLL